MKQIQLTKNEQGFDVLDSWYDKFSEKLTIETTTERVETSFGFTDVMITPPEPSASDLPPLFLIHGAMAGAPHALGELTNLPAGRQIYAVNIPGQSCRAAQNRLNFKSEEYGCWLKEVIDHFSFDQVMLCGISWGGAVALRLAIHQPEIIAGLVLIVPASIVSGPVLKGIGKIGLPMLRYKMFPTEVNRDRAFMHLFTSFDDFWVPYVADWMKYGNMDFSAPPIVKEAELSDFKAPVSVIAADQDLSFPGEKLLNRCKVLFPNLKGIHLLQNSHHIPSFRDEDRVHFSSLFEKALNEVTPAIPYSK